MSGSSSNSTANYHAQGALQSIGSKAGGFLAQKFFHPTSNRNQEKMWLHDQKEKAEKARQDELRAKREEERKVEEVRRANALLGQGSSSGLGSMFTSGGGSSSSSGQTGESKQLKGGLNIMKKNSDNKNQIDQKLKDKLLNQNGSQSEKETRGIKDMYSDLVTKKNVQNLPVEERAAATETARRMKLLEQERQRKAQAQQVMAQKRIIAESSDNLNDVKESDESNVNDQNQMGLKKRKKNQNNNQVTNLDSDDIDSSMSIDSPDQNVLLKSESKALAEAKALGHQSVFGSYYDVQTGKWGYACCKGTDRKARCTVNLSKSKTNMEWEQR